VAERNSIDSNGWESEIEFRRIPEVEQELTDRRSRLVPWPPIAITDLVDPRPSFYRHILAEPQDPARWPAIRWGRVLHRAAAPLLAAPDQIELNFLRHGLSGRLDGWADGPVEIKSGAVPFGQGASGTVPMTDHLEQVGIYSALLGAARSTLALLRTSGESVVDVRVLHLSLPDPEVVREAAERRAERLRAALRSSDPSDLPRCHFRDRGCFWQTAGRCACDGSEPPEESPIAPHLKLEGEEADQAARIAERCRELRPPTTVHPWTISDLIYPRFAYYRTEGAVAELPAPSANNAYLTLRGLIDSGPLGESRVHEPSDLGPPIALFRGQPVLLKTRAAPLPESGSAVVEAAPQYLLEAGLRCAFAGNRQAWLLLGVARRGDPLRDIQLFQVEIQRPTTFARIARERMRILDRARAERRPETLPRCPAWRSAICPYHPGCGCTDGRSQR
jgi:hypothetical protein